MPIEGVIAQQNFERVRDALATILAAEFTSQYAKSTQTTPNPGIWTERTVPMAHTELPALNVTLFEVKFDNKAGDSMDAVCKYHVEAYTARKTTNAKRGDKAAAEDLHRMLGMARAILSDPIYETLGFAKPFLCNGMVEKIVTLEPENNLENLSQARGILVYTVTVPEGVELIDGEELELASTRVKLYNTGVGYLWGNAGDPPPDYVVTEDDVYFIME